MPDAAQRANNLFPSNQNSAATASYVYDALGQRVEKTSSSPNECDTSGGTVFYLRDLSGHTAVYTQNGVNGCHDEIFAGGRHLVTYEGRATFSHSDWLGTERLGVTAAYINQPQYDEPFTSYPFGDGFTGNTSTYATVLHFTGQPHDLESNLEFFGARYDASSMGRFLTPDWSEAPVKVPYADFDNPQSLNLYSYAKNNPITGTDPDGHCDVDIGDGKTEHHGWLWCAAHAIGLRETSKEKQARLLQEAKGFEQANGIDLIKANGHWIPASTASDADTLAWWNDYNQRYQNDPANQLGQGRDFGVGVLGARLTAPQANDLAKYLGFQRVKDPPFDSHGQPVFEKDGRYITTDVDGHSGGTWKEFDRRGRRIAKLDVFLHKIGE